LHTLHKAKKHFPYIFQYLTALHRNTGSVEVSGSIPLGSTKLLFPYLSISYKGF